MRLALVLSMVVGGCGGGIVTGGDDGGGGGGDGSGGVGDGGGPGCLGGNPQCVAPQVCGNSGHCLDPGSCFDDRDCKPGEQCGTVDGGARRCDPGGGCGSEKLVADQVPPNLLVVLDRSCSMTQTAGNMTKWQIAVAALNKLTTTYNGKIRFGLTMFPDIDNNQCGQGAIPIPVAPGNEMKIQQLLTAALGMNDVNFPDGPCVTNIDTGMQQASTEPAFNDLTRQSYALLLTDGAQSACNAAGGAAGARMIIDTLFKMRKVPTFVIGFGSGVNATQLNNFAVAGGVPTGNMMKQYYDAADQASLDAALAKIASQTLGCVYQLGKVPPDPMQIFVFFDKLGVPRDATHMAGWDYDPVLNQVTFYGAQCTDLKAGKIKVLDIVFGCDMAPPG